MDSSDQDPSVTDDELVEKARDGNRRAMDRLLRRHESRVLRVLRLLGVPAADREDVAQEVFIRIFRHLSGYRRGASFSGWIYRISVNASHDHRIRTRRRVRDESPWDPALAERADDRPSVETLAHRSDDRRRLEQALATLSERERAAFVLCELEGLDSPTAARSLGISSITVRRHLSRARRHLQRTLEKETKKDLTIVERPGPIGSR